MIGIVYASKLAVNMIIMFINTPFQVVGNPDIEHGVCEVGQDIYIVLLLHNRRDRLLRHAAKKRQSSQ